MKETPAFALFRAYCDSRRRHPGSFVNETLFMYILGTFIDLAFLCQRPRANLRERFLFDAMQLIQQHLMDGDLLLRVRRLSPYDRAYTSRLFKRHFGASLKQYVLKERLDRAKVLLSNGASVHEVAIVCGYADDSYFSKHFKHHAGVSPTDYKRTSLI